ncbi:cobalamin biosynthesis protein CbiX [Streptomyces noursei]|uniref:Cobalamin biosynthesis protein CbiX n=1 Tax=Streptomyces noursei TaxID=1971 RepID=A0A401QYS1_STRNR|nr:cobalamin biosynthesis protein CbiX [Streptomyces noursei]
MSGACPAGAPQRPDGGVVAGVGARRGVRAEDVVALVGAALAAVGRAPGALVALATVDAKAAEPGLRDAARRLGVPLRAFPAAELAVVRVPAPSAAARDAVGTPSVAEAAALVAAGPDARLVLGKRVSAPAGRPGTATCALAAPTTQDTCDTWAITRGTAGAAEGSPGAAAIVVPSPVPSVHAPGCTGPAGGGGPRRPPRTGTSRHQGDVVTIRPALLIAGHGTRHEGAADALRALVRVLGEQHPEVPVAGGFFGAPASPLPLSGAVDALVAQGATRLVVVPLLMAPTGPIRETLPEAVARAVAAHPGVRAVCEPELGPDPRLLAALERRLDEALGGGARRPEDRDRTTVLLVGRGAADPHANAEVVRAARLLWEGRGFAGVETAFVTLAAPDVPAGLDRCRVLAAAAPQQGQRQRQGQEQGQEQGHRIVVLPYFFFAGDLLERLRMQTEGWAAAHPGAEVLGAEPIGAAAELAEVVVARYRAAVADGAAFAGRATEDARPTGDALPGTALSATSAGGPA